MNTKVKFRSWVCHMQIRTYNRPRRVAIQLTDANDGSPIATATVNVPGVELADDEVIIKDYAENTGMLQALSDAGVVRTTGRSVAVGFVDAPVCKLLVSPS